MLNSKGSICLWRARWCGGFKIFFLQIFIVLIAGCSSGNLGGHTRGDATAPVSLPLGPVALIVDGSATETVQEIVTYNRYYKSGSSADLYTNSFREAYVDTSVANSGVVVITQLLEARLGKVQQFNSLEEVSRNGFKLIVKLDMQSQLVSNRFLEPSSYLSLDFFAADHQHIGALESSSRRNITPAWAGHAREKENVSKVRQYHEDQAQTLEVLRQKLYLVPVKS